MDKLIESVVQVLEQMILGVMALTTLRYILSGTSSALISDIKAETRLFFEDIAINVNGGEKLKNGIVLGLLLFLIYCGGVVSNSVAYWFLHPAHLEIIKPIEEEAAKSQNNITSTTGMTSPALKQEAENKTAQGGFPQIFSQATFFLQPFCRDTDANAEKMYEQYLKHEVTWRNRKLDALKHALDAHVKSIRLLRGVIFFSLCIIIAAFIKLLITLIPSSETAISRKNKWKTRLLVLGLALITYLLSMAAYRVTERQFHVMVVAGAQTVEPAGEDKSKEKASLPFNDYTIQVSEK